MGDAFLAAAAFQRDRLTAVRSDHGLTIEVRREAERLMTALVAAMEAKAQLSYRVAGLDLDSHLVEPATGVVGLTSAEAMA
jgi:hypothetical protein